MATQAPEKEEAVQKPSLVEDFKSSAQERLKELEPLVQEADELRAALSQVEGNGQAAPTRAPSRQSGSQPRRRRRSGVDRAQQLVDIVKANPGITVTEAAKKMKLKHPNYLYRIIPGLEAEGMVHKEGSGFHPGS